MSADTVSGIQQEEGTPTPFWTEIWKVNWKVELSPGEKQRSAKDKRGGTRYQHNNKNVPLRDEEK